MSSQRSGSDQSESSRKRRSILDGVYEENLRTKGHRPAARRGRRRVPDRSVSDRSAPPGDGRSASRPAPSEEEPARPSRGEPGGTRYRSARWATTLMAAVLILAVGAAYFTSGASLLRQGFFLSGASGAPPPVADSLHGRAAPFAPDTGRAAEERPRALPLTGGGPHAVASLFGLEVKTVVIDPGHGGKKDGAIGPAGTKEKHVALDVARRLKRRLRERYGYRILMTRTGDVHRSLRERVKFANRHQADLFLSIHVNSLPNASVTSVETYYYGSQATGDVLRLAKRENQGSGYSVAEFNRLLDRVGQTMRRQESRRLAAAVQQSLYRNVNGLNPDVRDWGVRTAPFVVLLGAEAPSILAEIGVISNPAEEQKLRRPAYRQRLARFLEEGVVRYLGGDASPPPAAGDTSAATLPAALR